MEYRFLLTEMANRTCPGYIEALIGVLSQSESAREHHDILFVEVMAIAVEELNVYEHE